VDFWSVLYCRAAWKETLHALSEVPQVVDFRNLVNENTRTEPPQTAQELTATKPMPSHPQTSATFASIAE
jgi:hypothetical protein